MSTQTMPLPVAKTNAQAAGSFHTAFIVAMALLPAVLLHGVCSALRTERHAAGAHGGMGPHDRGAELAAEPLLLLVRRLRDPRRRLR